MSKSENTAEIIATMPNAAELRAARQAIILTEAHAMLRSFGFDPTDLRLERRDLRESRATFLVGTIRGEEYATYIADRETSGNMAGSNMGHSATADARRAAKARA